jgi:hypothetical protein
MQKYDNTLLLLWSPFSKNSTYWKWIEFFCLVRNALVHLGRSRFAYLEENY